MGSNKIPLDELSIDELYNTEKATYIVPAYQRNYAWGKDEISTLVQDVYDSMCKDATAIYYIGTLVTFDRGEGKFEVIDGQQRLTTIFLVLKALGLDVANTLAYSARPRADATLKTLPRCDAALGDVAILQGFRWTERALSEIVPSHELRKEFLEYFLGKVKIVHYRVPKDVDLNRYFEIMNSRGEQLEKHEIVKARMLDALKNEPESDKALFNAIWNMSREMDVYVQRMAGDGLKRVFGTDLSSFCANDFSSLPKLETQSVGRNSINAILSGNCDEEVGLGSNDDRHDVEAFQPIIDFPNFLLIVLKLTRMQGSEGENATHFAPTTFNLDDKELLAEFDNIDPLTADFVRRFGFNLLKAKYFLDNRIVHHANIDDNEGNPWKLQEWHLDESGKACPRNIADDGHVQARMTQLLSMFEVSFTSRQRKNYLFYCLLYLFTHDWDAAAYCDFLGKLADKYFLDVYLVKDRLNEANAPRPGSFDSAVIPNGKLHVESENTDSDFTAIYGDGVKTASSGIPLFVFNYLDYRLWRKYQNELQGEESKHDSVVRHEFFKTLGCGDLDLSAFNLFYFSRTRRSLEHFFPQANTGKCGSPSEIEINCLGNYAMIGSEMNSSGSNWEPQTKVHHYLDDHSGKVRHVSIASLKFLVMLQTCKDNGRWSVKEIQTHQENMLAILGCQKQLPKDVSSTI